MAIFPSFSKRFRSDELPMRPETPGGSLANETWAHLLLNLGSISDLAFNTTDPATLPPQAELLHPQPESMWTKRQMHLFDTFLEFLHAPENAPLDPLVKKLQQANKDADLPDSPVRNAPTDNQSYEFDMQALAMQAVSLLSYFFENNAPYLEAECEELQECKQVLEIVSRIEDKALRASTLQELTAMCLEHQHLEHACLILQACDPAFQAIGALKVHQQLAHSGDKETAIAIYEKALEIIKENVEAENQRAFLLNYVSLRKIN